jgi:hypothetical protein
MPTQKHQPWFALVGLALGVAAPIAAAASTTPQSAGYLPVVPQDQPRITSGVDGSQKSTLTRSHSSLAIAAYDKGALPGTQAFPDLSLVLNRSATTQQALDGLVKQQTNPGSPYFHHWLTASQISAYGPQQSDVTKVTQWLQSHGLHVKNVSADGLVIHFSGNVAALNGTFNAAMHSYEINGEKHFANANAAQIPTALAPVVQSVVLHNFFPKPQHIDVGVVSKDKATGHWKTMAKAAAAGTNKPTPQFTVPGGTVDPGITYDMAPADFNTVYNVNPLWSQGTRGAGQTIVVLERTDINLADVATFRSAFLPADAKGTVTLEHPGTCADPGVNGDESEAALDAEWAGAAAPDANIIVAACADNGATPGFEVANISLTNSPAPGNVWSLSYGECESAVSGNTLTSYEYQEAEARGVTVFVSTGDAGSAACDQNAFFAASFGAQVNALASTPYDVAVGGTDFNDFGKISQYWLSNNLPLNASALSYIPEMTWNDSCASSQLAMLMGYPNPLAACNDLNDQYGDGGDYMNTAGGSGGVSALYAQPEWQTGIYGQTFSSSRTLPDVSLFAANGVFSHALVYCMSDPNESGTTCDYTQPDDVYYNSAGGTSFAAPAMAGVQALVNQASGGSSGNILPALYDIGIKQYGTNASPNTATLTSCNSSNGASIGSNCVFNNVTVGNIDVPCWAGTSNCYLGPNSIDGAEEFGLVYAAPSENSTTTVPAWSAGAGYNMATGLGSVNVTNFVNAMAKFNQTFADRATAYVAPYDFLSATYSGAFTNDGYSDIAVVDPVGGSLTTLAMRGSVVRTQTTQTISTGYTIGAVADYFPALDSLGWTTGHLVWTGSDNKLYVWISSDQGGFEAYQVGPAYPKGWKLMGSQVIDNSGVPQLLWYNATTSQYGWWQLGLDLDTFAPEVTSISSLTTVASGFVPALADLNGDGYGDLVWTNPSSNDVYAWINNQQGGFVPHLVGASRPDGYTLYGAGDVTGSGVTDLVWVNAASHQVQIWTMNGFNVTSQKTINYTAGYTLASIADYDGDGLADLLWVGTAGDVYDWQSTGNGGFQSLRVAAYDGTPFVVRAGGQIQGNWLQGSANGGVSIPSTH